MGGGRREDPGMVHRLPIEKMARVLQVIETTLEVRGSGRPEDPLRQVIQYWSLAGELLAESERGIRIVLEDQAEERK
jgi:hypothetical protein